MTESSAFAVMPLSPGQQLGLGAKFTRFTKLRTDKGAQDARPQGSAACVFANSVNRHNHFDPLPETA